MTFIHVFIAAAFVFSLLLPSVSTVPLSATHITSGSHKRNGSPNHAHSQSHIQMKRSIHNSRHSHGHHGNHIEPVSHGADETHESYPTFSYRQHPLYTLPLFTSRPNYTPPAPAVVREYHVLTPGLKERVHNAFFVPRFSSYATYLSHQTLFTNLDTLFLPRMQKSPHSHKYVSIRLNRPARVFVLVSGAGLYGYGKTLQHEFQVAGAPSSWGAPVAVTLPHGRENRPSFRRGSANHTLPTLAICMEVVEVNATDLSVSLPHPATLSINGTRLSSLTVLFSTDSASSITAFDAPTVPQPFNALVGDPVDNYGTRELVEPSQNVPVPNTRCPKWLHDLYVTPSADTGSGAHPLDPTHWRTWHPIIDPLYWCYFDHEHGSYPGNYRPMFGYMAWKMGQLESHNGFKIFSLPVSALRAVVITVHMHLSIPRRFTTRRHTVIFAVCRTGSAADWEVEMELHMKMDFGPAQVTFRNESTVPLDWGVADEVALQERKEAGRRFNVVDLSDFPTSVDRRYKLHGNGGKDGNGSGGAGELVEGSLARGIYEVWRGPLNTCSWSRSRSVNRGFSVDVRDPATAIRNVADLDSTQALAGKSMDRVLRIGKDGMKVGLRWCRFDIFRSQEVVDLDGHGGVFFTDPYMSAVKRGGGPGVVRQYIRADFEDVDIARGSYTPVRVWNSWMGPEEEGQGTRRSLDLEHAIDAASN